jgi:tyrosine-specific transport protein
MDSKLLGGILLIVGTSIGAGMLALPLTTASLGFFGSVALLLACWAVMTYAAFLVLEVNLWMPQNSNLITMAKTTLGRPGLIVAWISTVALLYSILCAYISGGSDLMHHLIVKQAYDLPVSVSAILFTLIFGGVIYLGMRAVDYVNRFMMFIKLASYILLIVLLTPLISVDYLKATELSHFKWMIAIMVSMTSFGYANIIPSLRIYFQSDVVKLKRAIFIGSLIPLICYVFWDAVIMGVIPIDKPLQSTSDLVSALTNMAASSSVAISVKTFTSICVVTSFLGVGLSLTDFLADGLHLSNEGSAKILITLLAFLPPLIVALFFPNVFVTALHYAGVNCVVLFVGLPALMVWFGRYRVHVHQGFRTIGGKGVLGFIILLSGILVVKGLMS